MMVFINIQLAIRLPAAHAPPAPGRRRPGRGGHRRGLLLLLFVIFVVLVAL